MKLARVEFSAALMKEMVKGNGSSEWWWQIQNPLPADAEYVYCRMAADGLSVSFIYYHDSFPDVPEGQPVPAVELTYRSLHQLDATKANA